MSCRSKAEEAAAGAAGRTQARTLHTRAVVGHPRPCSATGTAAATAGTYSIRPLHRRVSSAQIEIDVVYDAMLSHKPDGAWQRVAPLRILSFDIECR